MTNGKRMPPFWLFVKRIHLPPVNTLSKGQSDKALAFSSLYARASCETNDDDLGRHHAHVTSLIQVNQCCFSRYQDHSVYGFSQWETALHCNVVPHWPITYTDITIEKMLLLNIENGLLNACYLKMFSNWCQYNKKSLWLQVKCIMPVTMNFVVTKGL